MRMGIFVTHPIQYFAPMWRELARVDSLDLTVHFFSDQSVAGRVDRDFGRAVSWDVPVLSGYQSIFLSRNADVYSSATMRMQSPRQFLKTRKFDVLMIHGHTRPFEKQLISAAHAAKIPIIMRGEFSDKCETPRKFFTRVARDAYLRLLYRKIDAFCVIGADAARHLTRLGVPGHRLFSSPYSVDANLISLQRESLEVADSRQKLGILPGRLVILFSGKFVTRKRPHDLLRAIELLRENSVSLIMIGDGELHPDVSSRARDLLGDQAILPGFINQSELGRYFRAADLLVLPSAFDTWGLVVNEAMHFGLPAIVSDAVGCASDLIKDGQTGFTYRVGDTAALADYLRSLAANREVAQVMGAKARGLIANYTVEASVRGVLQSLRYVTAKKCSALPTY